MSLSACQLLVPLWPTRPYHFLKFDLWLCLRSASLPAWISISTPNFFQDWAIMRSSAASVNSWPWLPLLIFKVIIFFT